MNFLGIGPGEFFFILVLTLLVIGPERLPGFARSIGRNIVRLRNWVNNSPDAQVLMQVQRELEAEIIDIRTTLRQEVQSVRAEMQMVRNDLEQASRAADASLTSAAASATMSLSTNTIANPSTANLTPISASDVTTPMRLNVSDVAATQAELAAQSGHDATTTVSRNRKPNWSTPDVETPANTATSPTTDATTSPIVDVAATPASPPEVHGNDAHRPPLANNGEVPAAGVVASQQSSPTPTADIEALQHEIRQLKSASPSVSHDAFMMMKIEVEQLNRDLKTIREEFAKQKPTNSVSYDDMMMMRVQIGQLSHQIEQLNRQLAASKPNVEPSA